MNDGTIAIIIAFMAIGTFTLRYSFIYLFGRTRMPSSVERALRFVPPAALAALVLPALLRVNGQMDVTLSNPRWIAGMVAAVVAFRTKSFLLTGLVGMLSLWLIQWAG